MDETIRKGDLFRIIHAHCDASAKCIGRFYVASNIGTTGSGMCNLCNQPANLGPVAVVEFGSGGRWPMPWVKKVPPLDELEGKKTQEEFFKKEKALKYVVTLNLVPKNGEVTTLAEAKEATEQLVKFLNLPDQDAPVTTELVSVVEEK